MPGANNFSRNSYLHHPNQTKGEFFARKQKIEQRRKKLPIAAVERRLVEEVRNNDTLIIVGETGSGKTTQIPQYLFKGGFCRDGGIIGITQPRRVAAITVAKRVSEECGVPLGQKVGYAIRFEDVTSGLTKIKYMTDGLLLREALLDPYLSKYSVIIVDEAHERTIHTDVLLGLLKNVQKARSKGINEVVNTDHNNSNNGHASEGRIDNQNNGILKPGQAKKYNPLKLIIMSASLDARVFSEYFGGARAVHVQGRQFPVDIFYTHKPETDCIDAALITIFQVILATNIAETSVTIPGIKYVVDPGLVKARTYDPKMGVDSLIIVTTSKAQALQRSGRAGREGPGKCYRLYQESFFEKLTDSTLPEIKRCDLSNVVLQLKALGIDDVINFDFIEKPDRTAIVNSLWSLYLLGAVTEENKLSDVGYQMAKLPLDPVYSKALIVASQFGCLKEMLICVAMLSVESIFYAPREKLEESRNALKSFASPDGDHLTLLNVYRAADEFFQKNKMVNSEEKAEKSLRKWCKDNYINSRSLKHARDIHSQILRNVEQMGLRVTSCEDDMLLFRRCLAASFFLKAAMKQPDGVYRVTLSGLIVQIHPSSVLFRAKPECIIFNELVHTNHSYVRNVSRIDYLWLVELAPHLYALQD
ncbi:pre-mRNA-splicing factor ATP-dependent RNA helicase DEAH10 isoform X3 [Nicotiana tabacum]|uniref:RNA helicase n=1 Tax=Nicotiana tabacum TaxID=4097 RepID=A0A1S3X6C9_TOBAC|nr:PREDICTED: pre-mRNA-splicing factor ATP-dependent RNA helicase DEAH10-like isoform X1 [Nicotiana tabacum]